MFNLFKKKTKLQKLQIKYRKLLEEARRLSTVDRKLSDAKTAEANEVLKQIQLLQQTN